jgi:hypothetical protein
MLKPNARVIATRCRELLEQMKGHGTPRIKRGRLSLLYVKKINNIFREAYKDREKEKGYSKPRLQLPHLDRLPLTKVLKTLGPQMVLTERGRRLKAQRAERYELIRKNWYQKVMNELTAKAASRSAFFLRKIRKEEEKLTELDDFASANSLTMKNKSI